MEKEKFKETIDALTKLANVSIEQKQELLDKYSVMSNAEIIKDLSLLSYKAFFSHSDYLDYALTLIRNLNSNICPEIEDMKKALSNMFSNNIEGNMSLQDNHKLVSDELIMWTTLLNEYKIDYYIVGALPCFIKTEVSLFRYHDDIDIMIKEEDIPKIMEITDSLGYQFQDDRFPTKERFHEIEKNKPPHTVMAQNPNNEFHIGFFCFRREQNNSITTREYSHRLENEEVITDVMERSTDPIGASLRYDETPTNFKDTTFKTSSIESVYKLKQYTNRPKDITDIKKLKPHVDEDKLIQLSDHKMEKKLCQTFHHQ